jgi:hypothetical protein
MYQISVESSCISKLGYSKKEKVLRVLFKNGTAYRFYDVGPKTAKDLFNADSKGSHFNQNIQGKFSSDKIED